MRFPYFTEEETEAQRLSNLPKAMQPVRPESPVAERTLTRVGLPLHVVCARARVPTHQGECEEAPGSVGTLSRTQRRDTQSRLVGAWAASLCVSVFVCRTSVRSCDGGGYVYPRQAQGLLHPSVLLARASGLSTRPSKTERKEQG